jgi:hypothetical protein
VGCLRTSTERNIKIDETPATKNWSAVILSNDKQLAIPASTLRKRLHRKSPKTAATVARLFILEFNQLRRSISFIRVRHPRKARAADSHASKVVIGFPAFVDEKARLAPTLALRWPR